MVDGSDQLRFNVHVAPDPARMATSFKMRPGPVIIEQLPTRGRHVESLPERMEIASKLARRQLEHIMLRWAATRDTVTQSRGPLDQQQPQQRHSPPTSTSHTRPPPSVPPTTIGAAVHRHPPPAPSHRVRTTEQPSAPPSQNTVGMKSQQEAPRLSSRVASNSRSPAELLKLRQDLVQQVKRLLQILLTDSSNAPASRPQCVAVEFLGRGNQGRVLIEEEEERVREARRTEGQLVRNNRMLYQLKQKVTTAEREYSKYVARSHGSAQPNKCVAVSSLATGLRTAVRTLQSVTCNGVTLLDSRVCSELASLLEQLATLASQLLENDGGSEHELSLNEVIAQLKQHLETKKAEEHRLSSPVPPPTRAAIKPNRGRGKGRRRPTPGVLIVRQTKCSRRKWLWSRPAAGTPGYTKPTFASTVRQSPRRPYLHSSIRQHPSSPPLDTRQFTNISPVPHISSPMPHSATRPALSRPPVKANKKEAAAAESEEETGHHPHDLAERELMRQVWLDTRVTEQVHDLQEMRKKGEHELEELQGLLQRPRQLVEEAEKTIMDKLNPILEQAEVLKASHITGPQDPPPPTGNGGGPQRVDLELMLQKLEEFEREEGKVRERWRTIVYEDQALPGAGVVRGVSHCRQFHPVLPRGVASAVDSYSDRYTRYRQRSESKRGVDTNLVIECLTEEILDEIVGEVSGEVDAILTGCVDDMFAREFYQPSSC